MSCEKRWPLRLLRLLSAPRCYRTRKCWLATAALPGTPPKLEGLDRLASPGRRSCSYQDRSDRIRDERCKYGADKRSLSRIQLLNGFADVRENVDEVMLAIKNDDVLM